METTKILTISAPEDEKFLRKHTSPYDFKNTSKKETDLLVKTMRTAMDRANGIGLAANQIGVNARVFVAKVDNKFYTIFNPEIIKSDELTRVDGEGCLSVPERFGSLKRYDKITIKGYDKNGKPIKIKAWGLLAWVFQHETDHLNGKLFIDSVRKTHQ